MLHLCFDSLCKLNIIVYNICKRIKKVKTQRISLLLALILPGEQVDVFNLAKFQTDEISVVRNHRPANDVDPDEEHSLVNYAKTDICDDQTPN